MKGFRIVMALVVAVALSMGVVQAEGIGSGMKKGMKMPKNYRMVPMAKAQILQKGETKIYCPKCGMTLPMFYRTNHAATVNGKVQQFCSLYCLVEAMHDGAKMSDIKVVDNSTLTFISAEKAFYVVGSSKPATMAKKVSKYAFGTRVAAEEFAKKFGGKAMGYDEALAIAKKNFESDTDAKKIRQSKAAKKGEMLYKKRCKPIEQKFQNVAEAKAYIRVSNVCGDIKGKMLQTIALYLVGR